MTRTMTPDTLVPAVSPTFYFIGVTTGRSSIRSVFPRWSVELGLGDAELVGIDIAIHASPEQYRRVVAFLKSDPLSLGALVTTHKLDLFTAAEDLFEQVDPLARLMCEVSCISKRGGVFSASAKDPYSSGLAIEAFAPSTSWEGADRELFIMGAGGSAIAMDWYLSRSARKAARPARVTITNRSAARLDSLRAVHDSVAADVPLELVCVADATENDAVLSRISAGALVVNATGLGKDAPGSPLSDTAVFPERAAVWDLNYRGDLCFLQQARAQQDKRDLVVEDGWVYFLHGWTQVIADVFDVHIPTEGPVFDRLSDLAAQSRD